MQLSKSQMLKLKQTRMSATQNLHLTKTTICILLTLNEINAMICLTKLHDNNANNMLSRLPQKKVSNSTSDDKQH